MPFSLLLIQVEFKFEFRFLFLNRIPKSFNILLSFLYLLNYILMLFTK